jgi:hypothetical protein
MSEPTERPILFSGPMVRAILDGRKTQTRRAITPQPTHDPLPFPVEFREHGHCDGVGPHTGSFRYLAAGLTCHKAPWDRVWHCPYGVPGERLWVREPCYIAPRGWNDVPSDCTATDSDGFCRVVAWDASMDGDSRRCAEEYGIRKTPSIHMPRWASRLLLEVVDVRAQRLQDITDGDCYGEGAISFGDATWPGRPRECFRELWDRINGKRAPWDENPWVWAVTFRRIETDGGEA